MGTINSNGVRAGYHNNICKVNLVAKCKVENTAYDGVKKLIETSVDDSCTEHLDCLFIKNSGNGRYRSLKTILDNIHTVDKYF